MVKEFEKLQSLDNIDKLLFDYVYIDNKEDHLEGR